ncbi:MAG: peptidoglycan-associated lipoprotein [Desulfobacteraceae bacterium]|nr:MAG: peptidoglycan-associated lipoprotein [Desulfobacteraceae bacterium]
MRKVKRNIVLFFALILAAGLIALWFYPKRVESAPKPTLVPSPQQLKKKPPEAFPINQSLKPIYFDFGQGTIRNDAKDTMRENADWLKANPSVKIRIEGNCDEREEDAQALGQRRATNAKRYLTDLGIPMPRIYLISNGKEKPVCTADTEECWQKNRRADFVTPK